MVWAVTGCTARAKPEASDVTTNPRRVKSVLGRRLSASASMFGSWELVGLSWECETGILGWGCGDSEVQRSAEAARSAGGRGKSFGADARYGNVFGSVVPLLRPFQGR